MTIVVFIGPSVCVCICVRVSVRACVSYMLTQHSHINIRILCVFGRVSCRIHSIYTMHTISDMIAHIALYAGPATTTTTKKTVERAKKSKMCLLMQWHGSTVLYCTGVSGHYGRVSTHHEREHTHTHAHRQTHWAVTMHDLYTHLWKMLLDTGAALLSTKITMGDKVWERSDRLILVLRQQRSPYFSNDMEVSPWGMAAWRWRRIKSPGRACLRLDEQHMQKRTSKCDVCIYDVRASACCTCIYGTSAQRTHVLVMMPHAAQPG